MDLENINKFMIAMEANTDLPPVSDSDLEDSMTDTKNHIDNVNNCALRFRDKLKDQVENHDASKLESPEKELFAYYGPILSKLKYGSDEYKDNLKKMGEALKHHYENNTHHPEHYKNGISDMNLLDVVEMLCDWKASTMRTNKGDIYESLEINSKRFHIDDQLKNILLNTINVLWPKEK